MRHCGGLLLGTCRDARDLKLVADQGIQAVLDLALDEPPAVLFREVAYLRVPLVDGAGNPPALLRLAVATVERLVREEVPTLLACSNGMSRSPSVVAFALARISGRAAGECLPKGPLDVSEGLWHDLISCG
jgi:protein-tyrosine phosphatase